MLKTLFEQAKRDRIEVEDKAGQHGYGIHAMDTADREMQQSLLDMGVGTPSQ